MNQLYYGDNLQVLRDSIADESIDLIYLDPPFNSSANYNVLFRSPKGEQSEAQIEAFEDTWHWSSESARTLEQMKFTHGELAEFLDFLVRTLGYNDLSAYLVMMAARLRELHRVLKSTGSFYLHCDPTSSHYLKMILDMIFGARNHRNEISWRRSQTRSSISKVYRRAHDVIFFYSKSDDYQFNLQYKELSVASKKLYFKDEHGFYQPVPLLVSGRRNGVTGQPWRGIEPNKRGKEGMHWVTTLDKLEEYDKQGLIVWPKKEGGVPRLKYYLENSPGVPLSDFWDDVDLISSSSAESLGYPTQKPLALLERIIQASSNPGDIVLDPFCGCGTAVHAAQKLDRQWIGIDITHLAISLIEKRLKDAFPDIKFTVEGTPKDLDGARNLAERDKYQFQWWACSLVNAQPYQGKKKGADTGIDGQIFFTDYVSGKATIKKIIVSVKGGANVSVPMVRDLVGTVQRTKAEIGLFITLAPPSKPMLKEAASAGFYKAGNDRDYARIQILTIEDLLTGHKRPEYFDMSRGQLTFKKAQREAQAAEQMLLENI